MRCSRSRGIPHFVKALEERLWLFAVLDPGVTRDVPAIIEEYQFDELQGFRTNVYAEESPGRCILWCIRICLVVLTMRLPRGL